MSAEADETVRAEIDALKAVVYGPHPPAAAIARLAALRAEPDAPPPVEEAPPQPVGAPLHRRRVPAALVVAFVLAVALCATVLGAGRGTPPPRPAPSVPPTIDADQGDALAEETAVYERVLDHPERFTARDWFAVYPAGLPRPWSTAGEVRSYRARIGPGALALPVRPTTSALLVFLVCSAPDTPYRWTLTGHAGAAARATVLAESSGDQCRGMNGRVVAVPPGSRDLTMRMTLAPGIHYSVTVYER